MKFTNEALSSYSRGVADGTITDTVAEIIEIIMYQEIVSYCPHRGTRVGISARTYTFDTSDIVMGEV